MTRERCSTCDAVLLWATYRLVCPRPHCPGHPSLSAASSAQGALPVAAGVAATGDPRHLDPPRPRSPR
jgi:hypothetical protein